MTIYFSLIREKGSKLDPEIVVRIIVNTTFYRMSTCFWEESYAIVWYGVSMLCYEISMQCYAMVYVVKDKHSGTEASVGECKYLSRFTSVYRINILFSLI